VTFDILANVIFMAYYGTLLGTLVSIYAVSFSISWLLFFLLVQNLYFLYLCFIVYH